MSTVSKLVIKACSDNKFSSFTGEFITSINPENLIIKSGVGYHTPQSMAGAALLRYCGTPPRLLSFSLLFDNTGIIPGSNSIAVMEQVNQLQAIAYHTQKKNNAPNYIRVVWGQIDFKGRLVNLEVTYSMFQMDGTLVRAEAKIAVLEEIPVVGQGKSAVGKDSEYAKASGASATGNQTTGSRGNTSANNNEETFAPATDETNGAYSGAPEGAYEGGPDDVYLGDGSNHTTTGGGNAYATQGANANGAAGDSNTGNIHTGGSGTGTNGNNTGGDNTTGSNANNTNANGGTTSGSSLNSNNNGTGNTSGSNNGNTNPGGGSHTPGANANNSSSTGKPSGSNGGNTGGGGQP